MKALLIVLLALNMGSVWAKKNIKLSDVNSELMKGVKQDVDSDNAEDLKSKTQRAPASVSTKEEAPESKIDKQIKQLGPQKW